MIKSIEDDLYAVILTIVRGLLTSLFHFPFEKFAISTWLKVETFSKVTEYRERYHHALQQVVASPLK